MDITPDIKNELTDESFVKVEGTPEEVNEYTQVQNQSVNHNNVPNLMQTVNNNGNVELVELESGQYTYILNEDSEKLEKTSRFDLDDGEHYFIEEYEGDEVEEEEPPQYETVYIESAAESPYEEGNEVYTISEEIEDEDEEVAEKSKDKLKIDDQKQNEQDVEVIYECSICSKNFKTPSGVKRHISMNHHAKNNVEKVEVKDELSFSLCPCCGEPSDSAHTTGNFKCEECEKLFIFPNALKRHKSIDHPTGGRFTCYECKKEFSTKEFLIDHTKMHSLKAVKCEDCGREFSRKYHLDRHIVQTGCMGVMKQVYECRVCQKSFTRKDNLAEHLKVHAGILHKKKRQYTCEFCMKEFSGLALLQIHVRTHTGERPYPCDICEKKFPSGGAMKKHRRKHTGERPYTCPQCGSKFAAKETLNRHWRTHTGEKPHQCKFCGKSFIQAVQLRAHIFHHTGENAFVCPHCNRAFNRKLRLTTHIKFMHEGAAPLPCPKTDCKKTFFRKEDIQRHLLTHSGQKPYVCEICDKSFTVKSSLRVHQNIHKKEMPVACEVCNRAFIRKDCLMRHMRARHRDVLEEIVANAEKKRLETQLLQSVAASSNNQKKSLKNTTIWNELTLSESIKELLGLLVDEDCLTELGHPDAPVDRVLETVIRRCGHSPALDSDYDYIGKLRENAKLLFNVVINDETVKELLKKKTVEEVILHVLKLARKEANNIEDGDEIEIKPSVVSEDEDNSEKFLDLEEEAEEEEEEENVQYPEQQSMETDEEEFY
ncbi:hypothetical protein ABEB36_006488 [Hypothenemus hampei]|uniref:C2H2-type domain-containing protein n=1 Tax=Hypothenemus hampei TaxID=57062 RepID=A0ABD1EQQ0_HYPHA